MKIQRIFTNQGGNDLDVGSPKDLSTKRKSTVILPFYLNDVIIIFIKTAFGIEGCDEPRQMGDIRQYFFPNIPHCINDT
jgi:hypothetical protein